MNINGKEMPEYNFGILTTSVKEAERVMDIAREYYDSYPRKAQFNASDYHLYYVIDVRGEKMWTHCAGENSPAKLSEILTLEEFTKKYITAPQAPQVIDNYQIY